MVGETLEIERRYLYDFRGIFILNELSPEYNEQDEILHLLFEFKTQIHFDIINKFFMDETVIHEYQPDSYHQVYLFKIPEKYRSDYHKFLKGKYSEISEDYKRTIMSYHGYQDSRMQDPYSKKYYDHDGANIVRILYKKEVEYRNLEERINRGLPEQYWTRVPRDLEVGTIWNETKKLIKLETLTKEMIK